MQKNPGKIKDLLRARQIAQELFKAQKPLNTEKYSQDIWEKINLQIDQQEEAVSLIQLSIRPKSGLMVAACIAGLLLVASAIYYLANSSSKQGNAITGITSHVVSNSLNHTNNTPDSRIVYLVDGSKITLQPGASLKHAVFLQKDKREVY